MPTYYIEKLYLVLYDYCENPFDKINREPLRETAFIVLCHRTNQTEL